MDGSWTEAWQRREREVHSHVAAGKVDVHADGDALLGHLDQVDAGTDDPRGFTSQ